MKKRGERHDPARRFNGKATRPVRNLTRAQERARLDEFIRLAKGKTNRQYLREIRTRAPLRALMMRTVSLFESVFFGRHQLDRASFKSCWTELDQFQQIVQHGDG